MGSVFDIPYQELKQWGPGELVDHDKLNKPVDALNALRRVGVNPPTQVIGTVRPPTVAAVGVAASPFIQAMVMVEKDDYLICQTLEQRGTSPAEVTNIAKPFMLRRTPFDGKTIGGILYNYSSPRLRVASKGSGSSLIRETQEITSKYNLGHTLVVAARVDGLDMQAANGDDILWVSIDDPRMFAEVP